MMQIVQLTESLTGKLYIFKNTVVFTQFMLVAKLFCYILKLSFHNFVAVHFT